LFFIVAGAGIFIFTNSFSSTLGQTSHSAQAINITFTGDVMLARGVETTISKNPHPFAGIIHLMNDTDLTVINLETPLTTSNDQAPYKDITLKTNPEYTYMLKDAGIDVACLANNHIMDYGQSGFLDTLDNLQKYGIKYAGAGNNIQEAYTPLILEIKGKKIAIIDASEFTSVSIPPATETSPGFAPISWNHIKTAMDNAKAAGADYIICEFHFGEEYKHTPNEFQKELSHKCIDYGAYMVVGHHSHMPQTIENYKGKLIFYSMGNCVFDQPFPETKSSMVMVLNLDEGQPYVQIYPIYIGDSFPELMNETNASSFLSDLQSWSVNVTIDNQDGVGIIKF